MHVVLVRDWKNSNWRETMCKGGLNIRDLCLSMSDEGVNIWREFTDENL